MIRQITSWQAIIVTIAMVIIFAQCEPNVLFTKALPPEINAINKIPDFFAGTYMCESDSTRIHVDPNVIYQESFYEFRTTIAKVRETENCSVVAGGLYLPGRKECIPFRYITEDTIEATIYDIDTLFHFSDEYVAKMHKGRLFLNYLNDHEHWVTHMITPQVDGAMLWELIDVPDRLKKVKAITTDYAITHYEGDEDKKYIMNPTLVEFEKIIAKKYTTECDLLIPLNLEIHFN